jgi:hypothetical protein
MNLFMFFSDFEYMVSIVINQALIFYEANALLSYDPDKTVSNIKSPSIRS